MRYKLIYARKEGKDQIAVDVKIGKTLYSGFVPKSKRL
jgi:hypothetical protein